MTVFLLVLLLVAGLQAKVAEATQVKRVSMEGYIGKRVDDCIRKRVMGQNVDELVEPFKLQDETQGRWASEFWGKWIQGAMSSYQYNQDPALYQKIVVVSVQPGSSPLSENQGWSRETDGYPVAQWLHWRL